MKLKEKYQINNETWNKLNKGYKVVLLLGSPFMAFVFAMITWPIMDGFSWTLVPIIPWAIFYLFALITFTSFFKYSKHTMLVLSLMVLLTSFYFIVLGSACIFRLFSGLGLIIEILLLIPLITFISMYSYQYWAKVWECHKLHNEECVLDLKNGRYDFVNNFNMDEHVLKKKKGKQYSNPALMILVYSISPFGVGLGMLLYRSHQITSLHIIMSLLSIPVALGLLKPFTRSFFNYRKLAYYEKQIGKPIINGLLE